MGIRYHYGDILKRKTNVLHHRNARTVRVQFICLVKPDTSRAGMWFWGITVRGDDSQAGMAKIGRINMFPYYDWVLDE